VGKCLFVHRLHQNLNYIIEIVTDGTKTGVIQFTIVPGVLSGYQLLMKPVVFTEVKEAASLSQIKPA